MVTAYHTLLEFEDGDGDGVYTAGGNDTVGRAFALGEMAWDPITHVRAGRGATRAGGQGGGMRAPPPPSCAVFPLTPARPPFFLFRPPPDKSGSNGMRMLPASRRRPTARA